MRKITMLLFLVIIFLLPVCADQISYSYYHFDDVRKNEVNTTSFGIVKSIKQQLRLIFDLELDQVSSPPLDGVTGATRPSIRKDQSHTRNRGQFISGVEYDFNNETTLGANFYISREEDYESTAGGLRWSQDLFQKNVNISLQGGYVFDRVGKISEDGSYSERIKESWSGSLEFAQVLSPTLQVTSGYDLNYLSGFLSDPYRLVAILNLTNLPENHPDTRMRHSLFIQPKKYIKDLEASLELFYRYYFEQWNHQKMKGISSNTYHVKLSKYFGEYLIFQMKYRYYRQSKAEFYQDIYRFDTPFISGDFKLSDFNSNQFGLGLSVLGEKLVRSHPKWNFLENTDFTVQWFKYYTSLDYNGGITQFDMKFKF